MHSSVSSTAIRSPILRSPSTISCLPSGRSSAFAVLIWLRHATAGSAPLLLCDESIFSAFFVLGQCGPHQRRMRPMAELLSGWRRSSKQYATGRVMVHRPPGRSNGDAVEVAADLAERL